jgi:hypothetical protein
MFDQVNHSIVRMMQGASVDCSTPLECHYLSAASDAPALSAPDEQFVRDELLRIQRDREKVLARFSSMMGLSSKRISFDMWCLAAVAASNQRLLSEQAGSSIQHLEELTDSDDESVVEDQNDDCEVNVSSASAASASVKQPLVRLRKKKVRQELKQRLQASAVDAVFCCEFNCVICSCKKWRQH